MRHTAALVEAALPAGWKVTYGPPKLEGKAEGISYSSGCEASGQTVTCKGDRETDKALLES